MGQGTNNRCCSTCTDMWLLVWKNWLLKKRRWMSLTIEIVLPVAFIILFSYLKTLEPNVEVPSGWAETSANVTDCKKDCQASPLSLFQNRSFTYMKGRSAVSSPNVNTSLTLPEFYATETSMLGFLSGLVIQALFNSPEVLNNPQALFACSSLITSGNLQPGVGCPVIPYRVGVVTPDENWFSYFNNTMSAWYPSIVLGVANGIAIKSPSWANLVQYFPSQQSFEDYIRDADYGKEVSKPKIIGALQFEKTPSIGTNGDWDYQIRLNATLNIQNLLYASVNTRLSQLNQFRRGVDVTTMFQYSIGGFATLQEAVTRFANCNPSTTDFTCQNKQANLTDQNSTDTRNTLIQYLNNDVPLSMIYKLVGSIVRSNLSISSMPAKDLSNALYPLYIAPQPLLGGHIYAFPVRAFTNAPFYNLVQTVFPLVFIAAFLFALSRILVSFIAEKEEKKRELLQMMGVSSFSIISSWYFTYGIIQFISCVLMTIVSKVSLFSSSNTILVFLFYYFFSLALISFAFLVSTFFSRARVGSLSGLSIFFMLYFVYYGVQDQEISASTKFFASILAPVAMALGANTMASFESSSVGVNFGNASDIVNNYTFGTSLGMMLFDAVLYTILGIYFEQVLPRQWGVRKKWYFCLSPRYWRGARKLNKSAPLAKDTENADAQPNVEPVSMELREQEAEDRAVIIDGLRKEFDTPAGKKVAVKGLDLTMYEGQITCLLGHNGAGKTTTISMLTGMIEATSGDAKINGYNISEGMAKVRQSLGFCPQHDVLYVDLTVKEHLQLFGSIKGMRGKELKEEVEKKVAEVGLTEKVNARVMELSGGMKRKLSVAMALLGGSKMVFLDEPTSGMDPYSRRSTWDLIQNNKEGRVIVLTTHFMDEADLLGDRIAIMADGELRCCGSSLFLKNRYGVGYNLALIKKDTCRTSEVERLIRTHVSEAKLLSSVGAEIIFQLPISSSGTFPAMFNELDDRLDELQLLQYGISVTTLEEVFLKVAEQGDLDEQENFKETASRISADSRATSIERGVSFPPEPPKFKLEGTSPPASATTHFQAVFMKRFQYAKRDKKAAVCAIFLPLLLLTVGLIQLKVSTALLKNYPVISMNPSVYQTVKREAKSDIPTPYVCLNNEARCTTVMSSMNVGVFPDTGFTPYSGVGDFFNVLYPNTPGTSNDGFSLQFAQDVYKFGFGNSGEAPRSGYSQYGAYVVNSNTSNNQFSYNLMINTTSSHAVGIFKRSIDEALYQNIAGGAYSMNISNSPMPLTKDAQSLFSSFISFSAITYILFAMAFIPSNIASFIVQEREVLKNAKHQQLVSGISLPAFWLANYAWDFIVYLVTFFLSIALIAAFEVTTFTGAGCEKNCIDNVFLGVCLLLLLYGLSIIPFTYTLQYIFGKHTSAQYVTYFINFILGLVLMIVTFVMRTLEDTRDTIADLVYFFRLFPPFCLGEGLLNLTLHDLTTAFFAENSGNVSVFSTDIDGWIFIYMIVEIVVYTAIAIAIDLVLCNPSIKAKIFKDPKLEDDNYPEDDDVVAERNRITEGKTNNDLVIIKGLRKVYKGLNNSKKVALKNLYYSIPAGQCFGFLGINGAGKTSTMKIITGEVLPTSGTALIGGKDILKEQLAVRRLIGYCPQFDALLDLLTVREHLELFAKIKGVPKDKIAEVVREKMVQMDLTEYENKLAMSLSGGNKRKLSVGIAMIGSPPVLFLDEPSTGMDPVARRFMWEVIAKVSTQSKECSVVLTTHSMEECEALCTNVGIMVGGRLRCLGSVQHLKSKFGRGLMLEIRLIPVTVEEAEAFAEKNFEEKTLNLEQIPKIAAKLGNEARGAMVNPESDEGWPVYSQIQRHGHVTNTQFANWWIGENRCHALSDFMKQTFGEVELLERHETLYRWRVLTEELSLAKIFGYLEVDKSRLFIREYSVSQTSLEQVFNQFAATQEEEKGKVRGINK